MKNPGAVADYRGLVWARGIRLLTSWDFLLLPAYPLAVLLDPLIVRLTSALGAGWSVLHGGAGSSPWHARVAFGLLGLVSGFALVRLGVRSFRDERASRRGVVCPRCIYAMCSTRPDDLGVLMSCPECGLRFRLVDYARLYPGTRFWERPVGDRRES